MSHAVVANPTARTAASTEILRINHYTSRDGPGSTLAPGCYSAKDVASSCGRYGRADRRMAAGLRPNHRRRVHQGRLWLDLSQPDGGLVLAALRIHERASVLPADGATV